jgi:hypothetical protein
MGKKAPFDKKMLKALYATYGEKNLFNSGNFKPLTRNLTTGALLNRGHHCERCNAKMTQNCYESLHYAYCPTWVTNEGARERCGERFALHSDGCGKHSKVRGYNAPLFRAANGEDVDLAEFDDLDLLDTEAPEAEDSDLEAELATVDKAADDYLQAHGWVSGTFHQDYFALRDKEKQYATIAKEQAAASEKVPDKKIRSTFAAGGETGHRQTRAQQGKTRKSFAPAGVRAKKVEVKESKEERTERLVGKVVSKMNDSQLSKTQG